MDAYIYFRKKKYNDMISFSEHITILVYVVVKYSLSILVSNIFWTDNAVASANRYLIIEEPETSSGKEIYLFMIG